MHTDDTENSRVKRTMDNKNHHSSDSNTKATRDKWLPIIVLALFILLIAELFGKSCFFLSVLGIPCAGCGSTRAIRFLLQGKMLDALRMHPLIIVTVLSLVVITVYGVAFFVAKMRGKSFESPLSPRATKIVFFSLVTLYVVVYIIRMVLFFPDTEPMLYNKHSVLGRLIAMIRRVFLAEIS
jgi:hypothetical protein